MTTAELLSKAQIVHRIVIERRADLLALLDLLLAIEAP